MVAGHRRAQDLDELGPLRRLVPPAGPHRDSRVAGRGAELLGAPGRHLRGSRLTGPRACRRIRRIRNAAAGCPDPALCVYPCYTGHVYVGDVNLFSGFQFSMVAGSTLSINRIRG